MKNKILKIITVPFVMLFFSSSSIAADLNIAFFASSSENGYNQATWEGVKKAAEEAGNVNAEIFNGEFNATLQYGQIEDIIASGKFDGFVVVPNDTVGIAGAIEQAIEAGIKVASSLFPIGPDLTTLEPQVAGLTATAAGSPVYGATLQANEVVTQNGGKVVYTSTDQSGNFRIGDGLQINQNTGTISGRSFTKSLFTEMTPFILALS